MKKNDISVKLLFKVLCLEMKQTSPQVEIVEGVLKALLRKIISSS